MTRIARLAASLEEPLLVTAPVNVRYLTGLQSSNAAVLVDTSGSATVFTDFRYADAASALDGVDVTVVPRDILVELGKRFAGTRFAFEAAHVSYAGWGKLAASGGDPIPALGSVEALRAVKEETELDAIRRAAALSDTVFDDLSHERFTGRTERDVAWWIERRFRDLGAEGLSFDVIVAAGPNGARPHSFPGETPIEPGTLVVVDAGCRVDGYCSDCTRTYATGELPSELEDVYALCLVAQEEALAAVTAGVSGREVDAVSRVAIDAAGHGDHYGHGLGHGVGMEIHEGPVLRPESTDVLETGNVVTVEPGIYQPGVAGVRIEDLVVVTATGCERLTTVGKGLTVVE